MAGPGLGEARVEALERVLRAALDQHGNPDISCEDGCWAFLAVAVLDEGGAPVTQTDTERRLVTDEEAALWRRGARGAGGFQGDDALSIGISPDDVNRWLDTREARDLVPRGLFRLVRLWRGGIVNLASRFPAPYRKRPVEILALRWTGGDMAVLDNFLGLHWGRADAKDVPWEHDDEEEVVIYNKAEKTWIPCPVGWWIVRGVDGEFYPVAPHIFDMTYEEGGLR